MATVDFDGLFVLDLANNHQGNVQHARNIIRSSAEVFKKHQVRGSVKFQFRNLDTLVHPDFRDKKNIPHIPRFLETALTAADFQDLTRLVRECGLVTIATPFDEPSVRLLFDLEIEIAKVASCSANDWPLLKQIVKLRKPIIASTAGLSLDSIDKLYDFLRGNGADFALMHCVALYPTPLNKLNLNQIGLFRKRYPDITIGYSTHEPPDYFDGIKMAFALGARVFERHVGIQTEQIKLNAYSSTPEQIDLWLKAYKEAVAACGGEHRAPADPAERESLRSLMRGVYVRKAIKAGHAINESDTYFAMPLQEGQLKSGDWRSDLKADRDYNADEPLSSAILGFKKPDHADSIRKIVDQTRGMLNEARIAIGDTFTVEISHHYGLDRFREFGAVIIECINRSYAKKLIIQLPRQKHPYHYHRKKEETFHVLYGDLEVEIEGHRRRLVPGDVVTVYQNQWHKFQTLNGVIFEEISTTSYNDDSFYDDDFIQSQPREKRKTKLVNWLPQTLDGND